VTSSSRADTVIQLRSTLVALAPGTPLREGLERILRGRTGALIVVGGGRAVEAISTGGFRIDAPFTATGLRELAKMDGAITLDREGTRILTAGVHLMPDLRIPTEETGTRHRTAERVARMTGVPVISVSKSMQTIAVYVGDLRYVVEAPEDTLGRANQALATLERYKARLDEVSSALSSLEIEDLVTVREVAIVVQRLEMVTRIAQEIEGYVIELGSDGRLVQLQLEELVTGVEPDRLLVVRDYAGRSRARRPAQVLSDIEKLERSDLLDLPTVSTALGFHGAASLDSSVSPRGFRLLARVPRLPSAVVDRLIEHFGSLQKLLAASIEELQVVDGIGELRARSVREGLSRLAEASIDRLV
jgi:diadenylate cyclase